MKNWFKSGSPWIWMTAGTVSISLVSVLGLLLIIGWHGLSFFWPSPIYEYTVRQADGSLQQVIGEVHDSEAVPVNQIRDSGVDVSKVKGDTVTRYLIKTGNREFVSLDFRWLSEQDIVDRQQPDDLLMLERSKNGNFYGYLVDVLEHGKSVGGDLRQQLEKRIKRSVTIRGEVNDLEQGEIGHINYQLEQTRLEERSLELDGQLTPELKQQLDQRRADLHQRYLVLEKALFAKRDEMKRDTVKIRDMRGVVVELPLAQALDVRFPNTMSFVDKVGDWLVQIGKFVSDNPREANTEGGVFPAIFGTVFMVMLMAVIVTPFGVVAAVYLHEYAGNNAFTKIIRTAVINLAGVPSIVYGVFGLGFFVYMVGGSIDELFYRAALPSPTFGTPGVLWASVTLAILTLPVVIVSTEEGLARIPSSVRYGSLALGATKAETLWRIVLPIASPAIMTGLILAVARAAGEVAPLMLVGVVKSAPTLPMDGNFPYIHLDRKFMHLGFQIYDVGFQSPNVEAARPLVYATSFLLVTVIVGLNITAIGIRNHLREKYRSLEH